MTMIMVLVMMMMMMMMVIMNCLQMMWKQASDVEQDFIECNIDRNQVALFLQFSHLLTIMIVMISIKVFSENILIDNIR